MVQECHVLEIGDLADVNTRQKLKWAFDEATVEQLKPHRAADATTKDVAQKFASIAQNLRSRGHDAEKVAHFVNRMVFCMFAEDVDLLPKKMFERMLEASLKTPEDFVANAEQLFTAMAKKHGRVGYDAIDWFNGGLFEDGTALPLEREDIKIALEAARQNWSEINPSIMGTLFERGLDPSKRSQLGAHYTDAEKIMMIVRPVIIEPLLREWAERRTEIEAKLDSARTSKAASARTKANNEAEALRIAFIERLKNFRILDPACGSGNFLYLALKALKDIEARVNLEAESLGLQPQLPSVGPECVRGIEINSFAAELARVSVWIGEIQWMREKGFGVSKNPILKSLDTIECRDALLNPDGSEAEWPEADVIIGNPPFLGGKMLISNLGEGKVSTLFKAYDGRVPREADFVCYWFQKASEAIAAETIVRAGLVATNSIRGGTNRDVLKHIRSHGVIFDAWDDEPWMQDGAAVRVSIVSFCSLVERSEVKFDGLPAMEIYADLTARRGEAGLDLTTSRRLLENSSCAFMGVTKSGPFDVEGSLARAWLLAPMNPNGTRNSDVLFPSINGRDITDRYSDGWILHFGVGKSQSEVALYELPYEYAVKHVQPFRQKSRQLKNRDRWWEFERPRPEMYSKMAATERYLATSMVAKHRLFVWRPRQVVPENLVIVVTRDDDATFGILHSKFHELWSLRLGTTLEDRPRYTPTTCFETFPFPEGLTPNIPAADYANDPRAQAIAAAAARLNELRENWLNPADLIKRVPEVVAGYPDRVLPVDEKAAKILKDRTLTKLYNERPAWLDNAHKELDKAVAAAYGWPADLADDEILERLFKLNQERAAKQAS